MNVHRPADLAGDDHWAPEHVVLARRVLTHAGRLLVARTADGEVAAHRPLEGMAAVEQRYPAWAQGPFGEIEPEAELPDRPGVYALVEAGVIRYVGASSDLARTFSPRGLGSISRRDATRRGREEECRLNRLVTASAAAGRVVDLYVLALERSRLGARRGEQPDGVAAEVAEAARGAWHLPS